VGRRSRRVVKKSSMPFREPVRSSLAPSLVRNEALLDPGDEDIAKVGHGPPPSLQLCSLRGSNLEELTRSKEAYIEFQEEIDLAQNHRHVVHSCPGERQAHRREARNSRRDKDGSCLGYSHVSTELHRRGLLIPG